MSNLVSDVMNSFHDSLNYTFLDKEKDIQAANESACHVANDVQKLTTSTDSSSFKNHEVCVDKMQWMSLVSLSTKIAWCDSFEGIRDQLNQGSGQLIKYTWCWFYRHLGPYLWLYWVNWKDGGWNYVTAMYHVDIRAQVVVAKSL
jgi:hypothetical protein